MKNIALALTLVCVLAPASTLAQNAYITNLGSKTVSVIATTTNTVVGLPIAVGVSPLGVAVTPDRNKVYVTNHGSNTVSVIDSASNSVSTTIPVSASPFGVAVTPDGSKVYVAHDATPGTVSVIDTAIKTVVGLPIPVSAAAVGVAVAPDSSKVYVATAIRVGRGTGGVSVIDTATNTVSATIPAGRFLNGVAVTPDGSKVYVAEERRGGFGGGGGVGVVSVIDTVTNAVIDTVTVGFSPFGVVVTPDGSKVYVANSSGTVAVIETVTNAVIAKVTVGLGAAGVAVTPDGSKVYVANEGSNTVSVIDAATNTVIGSPIPVGDQPVAFGLFIQPAPKFAGVAGAKNCHGISVSVLATKFGGLNAAAAALGFSDVQDFKRPSARFV
jgi:YVTN family beta-propeller protein